MRTSALLCLGFLTGCAASHPVGIVPERPTLSLTRGRYVLPPDPPPPEPRSVEEQRRLEIEWPEVQTLTVTAWPRGAVQPVQVFAPRPCATPPRPLGAQSARPVGAQPVVVRVQNRRAGTLPMVLLEVQ